MLFSVKTQVKLLLWKVQAKLSLKLAGLGQEIVRTIPSSKGIDPKNKKQMERNMDN